MAAEVMVGGLGDGGWRGVVEGREDRDFYAMDWDPGSRFSARGRGPFPLLIPGGSLFFVSLFFQICLRYLINSYIQFQIKTTKV
eukprot:544011-Hanusia_phi.AAC.1